MPVAAVPLKVDGRNVCPDVGELDRLKERLESAATQRNRTRKIEAQAQELRVREEGRSVHVKPLAAHIDDRVLKLVFQVWCWPDVHTFSLLSFLTKLKTKFAGRSLQTLLLYSCASLRYGVGSCVRPAQSRCGSVHPAPVSLVLFPSFSLIFGHPITLPVPNIVHIHVCLVRTSWLTTGVPGCFCAQEFGEISSAKIMRDATTCKPRGFGFVNFVHRSSAQKAVSMTSIELEGVELIVSINLPAAMKAASNMKDTVRATEPGRFHATADSSMRVLEPISPTSAHVLHTMIRCSRKCRRSYCIIAPPWHPPPWNREKATAANAATHSRATDAVPEEG